MSRQKRPLRKSRKQNRRALLSSGGGTRSSSDHMNPVWSFRIADNKEIFSLHSEKACQDWCREILPKLKVFKSMTWAEIKRQTYSGKKGRRKTNHHFVDTERLPNNAKQRLIHLKLDDHDQLFSLRLNSRIRIYGIVVGHVFRIVWYDPDHRLYPSKAD